MSQSLITATGGNPDPLDTTGLCLLSLDGGGVRGLSTLYILKGLMTRLNHERKGAGLPAVKPCEVFDLIGGTSTGGLIAIMLGRLEMDVDECIDAYTNLMKAVFDKKAKWFPMSLFGNIQAQFDSRKLQAAIEGEIRKKGIPLTQKFNDGKERGCRTFVCSAAKETTSMTRIRSYTLPDETSISATITEAALATSAATGFFDPVSIGARKFVDGALGANNPVDEVEGEAANIWSRGTGDLKPLVKCFISIGTGVPSKKAIEDDITKFLSRTLVAIATETEETERKFIARWAKHYDDQRYFRFNVEQGLQEVGLAEFKEQGRMEAATDEYLRHQAQKSKVRNCVQNLEMKQSATEASFAMIIQEYRTQLIIQSQSTVGAVCRSLPFARNRQFVGRDFYLEKIESMLFKAPKIAISGLGGVGKTQIALELAYRIGKKHEDCSIFWVPATSTDSIQHGFTDIARELGLPGLTKEKVDVKDLVQSHLNQSAAGKWLLVIDNVDDLEIWNNELRTYMPSSQQGCVVCTTRNRKIAVKIAGSNVVEVAEMNAEVATQLLVRTLVDQRLLEAQQDMLTLFEQLAFLPLAIVQAARYISENGISIRTYLDLLKEQEKDVIDLLSEEFDDDGRYQEIKNPVATTWLISFEQIQRLNSLAAEYLSFIACVDPHNIPQSLLPKGPSRKQETDAVGMLSAYSFIDRRVGDGDSFGVHRLVHLAMRSWLRKRESLEIWTTNAFKRVDEVFPDDNPENRNTWRLYLAHARYILTARMEKPITEYKTELDWKFALCLYSDGRYDEAEKWVGPVIRRRKKFLGGQHPDTLTSRSVLASIYRKQGFADKTENMHKEILEIRSRVLGDRHPDTLASRASLASTYRDQGKYDLAEDLQMQLVEARKEVLGEEHRDTMASIRSLAVTYRYQWRLEEAATLEEQLLKTSQKVLGGEDIDTLHCMDNLATTYWIQQRLDEAEKLLRRVIEIRQRVYGLEHPLTLISLARKATIFSARKQWKDAEALQKQVIESSKRVLGKEHPKTLDCLSDLGHMYWEQNRLKEKQEIEEHVLAVRTKIFGSEHYYTLYAMANLAFTLNRQGYRSKAIELMDGCVALRTKVLGSQHASTKVSVEALNQWRQE